MIQLNFILLWLIHFCGCVTFATNRLQQLQVSLCELLIQQHWVWLGLVWHCFFPSSSAMSESWVHYANWAWFFLNFIVHFGHFAPRECYKSGSLRRALWGAFVESSRVECCPSRATFSFSSSIVSPALPVALLWAFRFHWLVSFNPSFSLLLQSQLKPLLALSFSFPFSFCLLCRGWHEASQSKSK